MRFPALQSVAALVALLLLCRPATAEDRVTLKSGVVINGIVSMERPSVILLELPDVGTIRIPREDILLIEKDVHEVKGSRVERTRNPEGEKRDSHLLRYDDLKTGDQVLIILTGEDHDLWRASGQRHFCRVEMIGERRMKVSTSQKAGALGEIWVPRDSIDRIVDIGKNPDLRFMLFDGAHTGAWLRVTTDDGLLVSGRLDEVTGDGRVRLAVAQEGRTEEVAIGLGDIRSLETISRKSPLELDLTGLAPGEPVSLHFWGQPDPVTGTFAGRTGQFLTITSAPAKDGSVTEVKVFKDAPITAVERLPVEVRSLYAAVARGDTVTVRTTTREDESVVRRAVTGKLVVIDFEAITIEAGAEAMPIPHTQVVAVDIPEESRLAALRGEPLPAQVSGAPAVLPGMPEAEARAALPKSHPGLDVTIEDGRVAKIECRAPWSGSPFGLPIGGSLANASAVTELVFDTQIEPKEGGFTTVMSHSLTGLVVTLYISGDSRILGVEISRR